jgi:hypothetical protein
MTSLNDTIYIFDGDDGDDNEDGREEKRMNTNQKGVRNMIE